MPALRGEKELRARLVAIGAPSTRRAIAEQWATETAQLAKSLVRVRTGKTQRSIRVRKVSDRNASVEAGGAAAFLEKGTPPHDVVPKKGRFLKFEGQGRTIFAKRVHIPQRRPRTFLHKSGRAVLRSQKAAAKITSAWDRAA